MSGPAGQLLPTESYKLVMIPHCVLFPPPLRQIFYRTFYHLYFGVHSDWLEIESVRESVNLAVDWGDKDTWWLSWYSHIIITRSAVKIYIHQDCVFSSQVNYNLSPDFNLQINVLFLFILFRLEGPRTGRWWPQSYLTSNNSVTRPRLGRHGLTASYWLRVPPVSSA